MNPAALQKLVADAITDNVFMNWRFYVALLSVGILCTVGAALLEGWGKKKGEIAATRADFDEVKRQLQETTNVAKAVESAISHRDWIQRERNTLKRDKLEQLVTTAFALSTWMGVEGKVCVLGQEQESRSQIDQFEMLSKLYFPELSKETGKLIHLFFESLSFFHTARNGAAKFDGRFQIATLQKDAGQMELVLKERKKFQDDHLNPITEKAAEVYVAVQELAHASYKLMEQLTNHQAD